MKESAVVIGGGINGLVAANYLARAGMQVTVVERQDRMGGACISEVKRIGDKDYEYPTAATVLGFMQDFVFRDTGLAQKIEVWAPEHPAVVWFDDQPCLMFSDIDQKRAELRQKWGETGDIAGYYADFDRVVEFVVNNYRAGTVPSMERAVSALGAETAHRWVSGTARGLAEHYFSSDRMKVFCALDVTESGPVSLDSPYSAFTIPLMSTGTIFGGDWGFVKGGLWKLLDTLAQLNVELGVRNVTSAAVKEVASGRVLFELKDGGSERIEADHVLFATDPLTAATLLRDDELVASIQRRKMLGTSGKLILVFGKPAVWRDNPGTADFDSAFKFIIADQTLESLEKSTQAVVDGKLAFAPGYFEIYCEGAGLRKLGTARAFEYDTISVFFKNMAFGEKGEQLEAVKKEVERVVLSKIENPEDLVYSILLTPRDLSEKFFFPQGNIDHIELCQGQTFADRNFSPSPRQNFYQFGDHAGIYYCGAGSFPCGSIAGTAGYMCATQLLAARKAAVTTG